LLLVHLLALVHLLRSLLLLIHRISLLSILLLLPILLVLLRLLPLPLTLLLRLQRIPLLILLYFLLWLFPILSLSPRSSDFINSIVTYWPLTIFVFVLAWIHINNLVCVLIFESLFRDNVNEILTRLLLVVGLILRHHLLSLLHRLIP